MYTSISRDFPTLNKILLLLAFSASFRWGCRQTSHWCRVFFKSLVTRPTGWESGTWDTAARNTCPITGIWIPQWQNRRALGSCIVELHWSKPEWQNISCNSCRLMIKVPPRGFTSYNGLWNGAGDHLLHFIGANFTDVQASSSKSKSSPSWLSSRD